MTGAGQVDHLLARVAALLTQDQEAAACPACREPLPDAEVLLCEGCGSAGCPACLPARRCAACGPPAA